MGPGTSLEVTEGVDSVERASRQLVSYMTGFRV